MNIGNSIIGSIIRLKKTITENAVARSMECPVPMYVENTTELNTLGKK